MSSGSPFPQQHLPPQSWPMKNSHHTPSQVLEPPHHCVPQCLWDALPGMGKQAMHPKSEPWVPFSAAHCVQMLRDSLCQLSQLTCQSALYLPTAHSSLPDVYLTSPLAVL